MSSTFSLDLSTAQVGTALAENFVNLTGGISQMSVENGRPPLLVLQNESGFGLNVVIQGWGLTFQLPAGGWTDPIPLPVTATGLSVTPLYAITGGGVAKLLGTIYGQNDPVVPVRTLGNSPIGGTITPMSSSTIENYLVSPGVLSGMVASKDVSVANQLDVTSGTAFVKQASGTIAVITNTSTTFLTSIPSTTYFLDLTSTGTYSFATSHSSDPNALPLWSVTTDGSGNILAVTAQGNYNVINIVPSASGEVQFGAGGAQAAFAGGLIVTAGLAEFETALSIVGGQQTAGALGVPAIVAIAHQVHVTSTGSQIILTFTPSGSGLYRVSVWLRVNNGTNGNNVSLLANYTEGVTNTGVGVTFVASFNGMTGAATTLGGAASVPNNFYVCFPLVIDASSSGSIQIVYHDPTNTPSDFVDAIIERLS